MNMTEKQLQAQIKAWKQARWNASQSNNASGVFKAQRELKQLYKRLDQLHK